MWITSLDFSLGIPNSFTAIKAHISFQDLLPPNSIMANLCISHTWINTITHRSLCVLETHPQTQIHLEATHTMTPNKKAHGETNATSVSADPSNQTYRHRVPAQAFSSSPWSWGEGWIFTTASSTSKGNCMHIPGRPSGIANPSWLHQAHEQRDFNPYMAIW